MNSKKTFIAAIIFILVFGFYYFYVKVYEKKKTETKEKASAVFNIKEEDVMGLDIKRIAGDDVKKDEAGEFSFKKVQSESSGKKEEKALKESSSSTPSPAEPDTQWVMEKPKEARANQGTIDFLVKAVVGSKKEEVIEEKAENLEKFGLKPPLFEVTISDGKNKESLEVGKTTIDKKYLYARKPDGNELFLINSGVKFHLEKKIGDFRDKMVFHINRDDLKKIAIKLEDRIYLIDRDKDEWKVSFPPIPRPSKVAINNYVSSLLSLQTLEFFDNTEKFRKENKIGAAFGYIELYLKDKPDPITLRIAPDFTNKKFIYAWFDGGEEIFGLHVGNDETIGIKRNGLIDKSLFTFDQDTVEELDVTILDNSYTFKRETLQEKTEKEPAKYKWSLVSPDKKELDEKKVRGIIRNIRNFYAVDAEFMDNKSSFYGLEKPQTVITGKASDGKAVFTMNIGSVAPDQELKFVRVNDEKTVELMRKLTLDNLRQEIETLVNPDAAGKEVKKEEKPAGKEK